MVMSPLPAPGVALRDSYRLLLAASEAGDMRASCRLSEEIALCSAEARVARSKPANDAYLQRKREARQALCEGFSEETPGAAHFLLRAAQQGHIGSMYLLAASPPMTLESFQQNMEVLVAYRRYSGKFLKQAADQGHVGALISLAEAYAEPSLWSTFGRHPDDGGKGRPYQAAKYLEVLQWVRGRLSGHQQQLLETARGTLSPNDVFQAQSEARSLVLSWPQELQSASTNRWATGRNADINQACEN